MKYPTIFDLVATELKNANIPFLLVGGFAVNSYGVTRNTRDVDFLIAEGDDEQVRILMEKSEYRQIEHTELFARYQTEQSLMLVDFLFVSQETFEGIRKEARQIAIVGHPFYVPSLKHLIAMKLHAIKNSSRMRELKDFPDILHLIRQNQLDVRTADFKELCLKYGDINLYNKIIEFFEGKA